MADARAWTASAPRLGSSRRFGRRGAMAKTMTCTSIRAELWLGVAWLLAIAAPALAEPIDLASPFAGVNGGGNTVPGASVPFGFVSLSPDTSHGSTSGYDSNGLILGFSATHVSGTGGAGKYGNIRVTPAIGDDTWGNLAFTKADEHASPGYYVVTIGPHGNKIRAE